jgi:transposase
MPDPYIDGDLVQRVDRLWDVMPLRDVAEIVPRHYGTLKRWSQKGYISTDVDWRKNCGSDKKANVRWVANLKRHGYSRKEISEKTGLGLRSVSRYLNEYADHT